MAALPRSLIGVVNRPAGATEGEGARDCRAERPSRQAHLSVHVVGTCQLPQARQLPPSPEQRGSVPSLPRLPAGSPCVLALCSPFLGSARSSVERTV